MIQRWTSSMKYIIDIDKVRQSQNQQVQHYTSSSFQIIIIRIWPGVSGGSQVGAFIDVCICLHFATLRADAQRFRLLQVATQLCFGFGKTGTFYFRNFILVSNYHMVSIIVGNQSKFAIMNCQTDRGSQSFGVRFVVRL